MAGQGPPQPPFASSAYGPPPTTMTAAASPPLPPGSAALPPQRPVVMAGPPPPGFIAAGPPPVGVAFRPGPPPPGAVMRPAPAGMVPPFAAVSPPQAASGSASPLTPGFVQGPPPPGAAFVPGPPMARPPTQFAPPQAVQQAPPPQAMQQQQQQPQTFQQPPPQAMQQPPPPAMQQPPPQAMQQPPPQAVQPLPMADGASAASSRRKYPQEIATAYQAPAMPSMQPGYAQQPMAFQQPQQPVQQQPQQQQQQQFNAQAPPLFAPSANTMQPVAAPPMFAPPPVAAVPGPVPIPTPFAAQAQPAQQPQFGQPPPMQHQQQFTQPPPQQFGQQPQQAYAQGIPQQAPYNPNMMTQQMANMSVGGQAGPQLSMPVNLLQLPLQPADGDRAPEPRIHNELKLTASAQANSAADFMCCTVAAFPQSNAILQKSKIPLGLIMSPYRVQHRNEVQVPVVNPTTIVRCRRCRTYINPFVVFQDGGMRWRCNMCFSVNDVPADFDADPSTGQRMDRFRRPELNHGVIEFIAPTEYMVRPPQPPVFLFIIDVSYLAVSVGAVATIARALLDNLDALPNQEKRTKIGIITVDSNLHFYNLSSELSQPQMLVVSDLEEVFLPRPAEDLLVNLSESREVVEALLQKLPDMFKGTQNTNNALGPAMLAAQKLVSPIGGKIVVFQTILPNTGVGALKNRDDPKVLDTPKETSLLEVSNNFYKTLAVDCSRVQISIDFFLFPQSYLDVATFDSGPHFTGGSLYVYPRFNAGIGQDVIKFATDFTHYASRPLGLEAVLRVRCSKGIRMTGFHGNFFVRSMDLLALPTVSPDNAFAYQMSIEENIAGPLACFQAAVLYTSSFGERRIRVLTLALPITTNVADLYSTASAPALANLLSKMAIERALTAKLEDARDALVNKLIEMLQMYKSLLSTNSMSNQLLFPENLRHFALFILSTTKHISLRAGVRTSLDERATAMAQIRTVPLFLSSLTFLPRIYALHALEPEAGLPGDDGEIVMPTSLRLSSEVLERHGVYIGDDGFTLYIWISRAVSPNLCQDLFGLPSYESIPVGKFALPTIQTPLAQRVASIVGKIRETRPGYTPTIICKEDQDPALRAAFLSLLVEDKTDKAMSYTQFLSFLREKVAAS